MSFERSLPEIRLLSERESPFGVPVWDLRPFTQEHQSFTNDERIARRFVEVQQSDGVEYCNDVDPNERTIELPLRYLDAKSIPRGPLCVAKEMEDKWNVYHYNNALCFVRSWTGTLVFRAPFRSDGKELRMSSLSFPDTYTAPTEEIACDVDFLIRTHLLHRPCPAYIPIALRDDMARATVAIFSKFGRWAHFAYAGDTTGIHAIGST